MEFYSIDRHVCIILGNGRYVIDVWCVGGWRVLVPFFFFSLLGEVPLDYDWGGKWGGVWNVRPSVLE
jgi:hypothetical protein